MPVIPATAVFLLVIPTKDGLRRHGCRGANIRGSEWPKGERRMSRVIQLLGPVFADAEKLDPGLRRGDEPKTSKTPAKSPAQPKRVRSRPVSRVLFAPALPKPSENATVIPLGAPSPVRSSDQPGSDAGNVIASLFGLAPGGVCRAMRRCPRMRCALTAPFHHHLIPLRGHRLSILCCTFRRLAPPRRYLAPCPAEPGLSSRHCCPATVRPTSQPRIIREALRLCLVQRLARRAGDRRRELRCARRR